MAPDGMPIRDAVAARSVLAQAGSLLLGTGDTLALHVPNGALPDGSKEIFVRILEYAEEELDCDRVLVWFDKNTSDRALFIRTFMYFGFSLLAPDMIPQSLDNVNSIVMVYKID